jgi:catechol 2,3-dioxygenase-like lactoylglutathione lyase family enzyme
MEQQHSVVAILPVQDLDESQDFFERLGFALASRYDAQGYRILRDPAGASVHLTKIDAGWVDADRNAHGIYLYSEDVDALAEEFGCTAQPKPWGLREFAVSDPLGTLVLVGWPA